MIEDLMSTYKTAEERRLYRTIQGETLLHLIIKNRCTNRYLEPLLVEGALDVNMRNDRGETALVLAAQGGLNKAILTLYKFGADINALTNDNDSALLWAIYRKRYMTAELLLILGANPALEYVDRRDAFAWAVRMDNIYNLKYMLQYYPSPRMNSVDQNGWSWETLCKSKEMANMIEQYKSQNILLLVRLGSNMAKKHSTFERGLVKEIASYYRTIFEYVEEAT